MREHIGPNGKLFYHLRCGVLSLLRHLRKLEATALPLVDATPPTHENGPVHACSNCNSCSFWIIPTCALYLGGDH